MGGPGSGSYWRFDNSETTEDYRALDIRRLHKKGLLRQGPSFNWRWLRNDEVISSVSIKSGFDRIFLTYRHRSYGQEWKDEKYPVHLDWTACNFGGKRPWFLCPAIDCGRRVAIIYGGGIFACRHCYQLAYQSQNETWYDRAARRAEKIRERLQWMPGILNGGEIKPKGMHWKTYSRLVEEHNDLADQSIAGMIYRLGPNGLDI